MKLATLPILLATTALFVPTYLSAITEGEQEEPFVQPSSVLEKDMPALSNQRGSFRGAVLHEGLEGHTWVAFPFVENPGSFGFDAQGRLYVAEANRFWRGVPDLRGATEMIADDFRSVTVADRLAMYKKHGARFTDEWLTQVADRVILLEDRDGNGAADHRSVFSDRFHQPADGIGFSLLADGEDVYFTCIPSVWRLRDTNGDGRADEEEEISTGYGVHVTFIGHDLHGLVRGPDGRLYFSVGDRSYYVTTADGKEHPGKGRGAVFRCEMDGSGLEIVAVGLRNPQELAFDDAGNLFTVDNTGDIGDKARFVYVLEGSDSGWNMGHQSAHHYAPHLDWGDFRPEQSMWVKEHMFDLYSEDQPQWVYPPASHVSNGPSGLTWMTGESLPEDLRNRFLLADYRGASSNCKVLTIRAEHSGAGFVASEVKELANGVGVSDVELGYDGNLYLCDFGGGWSVNENGSIQVLVPKDETQRRAGAEVAELVRAGFSQRSVAELKTLLSHPDKRVRQFAQFALVDKKGEGRALLRELAAKAGDPIPRLHAVWGLGQMGRQGEDVAKDLLALLKDSNDDLRLNAVRVLGDLHMESAKDPLLASLRDDSAPAVRSLAAIGLGRIAKAGDKKVVDALFAAAVANEKNGTDIVLRHSLLSGLSLLATEGDAAAKANSNSREERLLAVLTLRRLESPQLQVFLKDKDPLILQETIRAIYDTAAMDTEAGKALAQYRQGLAELPEAIQRRIVAANYRVGTPDSALAMVRLAAQSDLAQPVRKAALNGLMQWPAAIETDPVFGYYRPQVIKADQGRSFDSLKKTLEPELVKFLRTSDQPELTALGMELSTAADISVDSSILSGQAADANLPPVLRVAAIEKLLATKPQPKDLSKLISGLLDDSVVPVRAEAMKAAFALGINEIAAKASKAVAEDSLPVARAAIVGLAAKDGKKIETLWNERETQLRKSLWLDAYLALVDGKSTAVSSYAASDKGAVHDLALWGGDPVAGEIVFKNQGACLQCHKVGGEGGDKGGVQGPNLYDVSKRLSREKILESVVNPNAEIAEGYGMTTVTLKNGDAVLGRLASESDKELVIILPDESERKIARSEVKSVAPPVSAMPPIAEALPPRDLRDLVAFLASQNGGKWNPKTAQEEAEKIAK